MKIVVLTPTRGRPAEALNMAQSCIVKASDRDNINLWFWIDSDDPTFDDYYNNLHLGPYDQWVTSFLMSKQPLGKCWNFMATHKDQNADIFFMGNDDWVMQTEGWDDIIRQEASKFPDGAYVLYPHDSNDGKCTFPIVSKKWVETLGYLYPEIFEFLAHDTYASQVGSGLGRLVKIPVTLDHKHFAFGKSKYDETYAQWRKSGATKRDVMKLSNSADLVAEDINKLKQLMK